MKKNEMSRRAFIGVAAFGLAGFVLPRIALADEGECVLRTENNSLYELIPEDYLRYADNRGGNWVTYRMGEDGQPEVVNTYESYDEFVQSQVETRAISGTLLSVLVYVGKRLLGAVVVKVIDGIVEEITGYDGGLTGMISDVALRLLDRPYQQTLKFDCDFYPPHSFQWVKCVYG